MATKMPPGWVQVNVPMPTEWKAEIRKHQQTLLQDGKKVSFEQACRDLIRTGLESNPRPTTTG